ncbi:MAG: response regulator, partial [Verrucomicrobiota bacterium]
MKVIERVLVVDRSELIRQTVGRVLRTRGIAVAEAGSLAMAWKYLEADHFQMVLAGDVLPDGEGVSLVRELATRVDAPYIISLLEKNSTAVIEQQREAGAHEVVVRPFAERDLRDFFDRARRHLSAPPPPAPVAANPKSAPVRNGVQILGRSPATQHLRDYICRVAPTNATVLIQGESGTGKELVARALHQQS